jgi:CHASE2 domain-containing sensor protein
MHLYNKYKLIYSIVFLSSFFLGVYLIDSTDFKSENNIKSLIICFASALLWLFVILFMNKNKKKTEQELGVKQRKRWVGILALAIIWIVSIGWLIYSITLFVDNNWIKAVSSLITSFLSAALAIYTKKNLREEYR